MATNREHSIEGRMIAARRKIISKYVLQNYSVEEIIKVLKQRKIVNHKTGKGFSPATITRDIRELTEEWKAASIENIDKCKVRIWAELQLIKKEAWKEKNWAIILSAIKKECELLGLDAYRQQEAETKIPQVIYIDASTRSI
jgi:hypothetical protein